MDVEECERLAARVRRAAEEVGLRRAGLARDGAPGWVGEGADAFGDRLGERAAALAALEDELGWLAGAVDALASAVRAERELAGGSGPLGLGRAS